MKMQEKIIIKNRKSQNVIVLLEKSENQKGLAFVMHALGASKEQPQIQAFAEAFLEKDFTVVRFDAADSFGESEGNYEDATVTSYYSDLEDVINWAKEQDFYQEPFCLAGHSLGGISTAFYAENHPKEVKGLALISVIVSGKLSLEAPANKDWPKWKKAGFKFYKSTSTPGLIKKLKWSHYEDRMKYNLLEKVDNLMMPVLLIAGSGDNSAPEEHQKMFFDRIISEKEMHIIHGEGHDFKQKENLEKIKQIFKKWISEVIQ